MIKNLILITVLFTLLFSCGKKGDLENKANKDYILTFKI